MLLEKEQGKRQGWEMVWAFPKAHVWEFNPHCAIKKVETTPP